MSGEPKSSEGEQSPGAWVHIHPGSAPVLRLSCGGVSPSDVVAGLAFYASLATVLVSAL